MELGIDISHWDEDLNFTVMKQSGVQFCVAKATQGNYLFDSKFIQWANGSRDAGLVTGAYHWIDPEIDDKAQCDYFINKTKPLLYTRPDGEPLFTFIALDVEQYENGRGTTFNPTRISQCVKDCSAYIKRTMNMPVVIYTRTSFIIEHASPMLQWMNTPPNNYPIWLAQYPYSPGVVNAQWNDFLPGGKWQPKTKIGGPTLPSCYKNWDFWQFTGDKFRLPGTANSQMDVNFFNGTLEELWLKYGNATSTIPPVTPLTIEERVAKLESEAKRNGWNI